MHTKNITCFNCVPKLLRPSYCQLLKSCPVRKSLALFTSEQTVTQLYYSNITQYISSLFELTAHKYLSKIQHITFAGRCFYKHASALYYQNKYLYVHRKGEKMFVSELAECRCFCLTISDTSAKKDAPSFTVVGIRLNAITIFAFCPIAPFYGQLRLRRQLKWRSLSDVFTGHFTVPVHIFESTSRCIDKVHFLLTTMCRKHFIMPYFTAGVT